MRFRFDLAGNTICALVILLLSGCGGSSSGDDDSADGSSSTSTGPVDRGTYIYQRIAAPEIDAPVIRIAAHPDGSYMLALAENGEVYVLNSATDNIVDFDPTPAATSLTWEFVEFDPGGQFALLGGYTDAAGGTPVLFRFDDSAWRTYAGDTMTLYSQYGGLSVDGDALAGIALRTGDNPVLLTRTNLNMGSSIARLYEFDPGTGGATILSATVTAAGCQDVEWVDNSFGNEGFLVVCGLSGADAFYYNDVGGLWQTDDPVSGAIGNISTAARHPVEEYALVVNFSGRRLHRFENNQLSNQSGSPTFPVHGIWRIAFNQDGSRALVVGRAGGTSLRLSVIEYRHDLYDCVSAFADCELTDVSIPDFDMAPYSGDANFYAYDAAWRNDCDGGVLAGGDSGIGATEGFLIKFEVMPGNPC